VSDVTLSQHIQAKISLETHNVRSCRGGAWWPQRSQAHLEETSSVPKVSSLPQQGSLIRLTRGRGGDLAGWLDTVQQNSR